MMLRIIIFLGISILIIYRFSTASICLLSNDTEETHLYLDETKYEKRQSYITQPTVINVRTY